MSSESALNTPAENPQADHPFRNEPTERDAAPQYVLPLVVHIEKAAPPTRTGALETAARAVLFMLSDERSLGEGEDEGEWARAMRDWQDARIRKVVRRARGAEWRKASALPGLTTTSASAEIATTISTDAATSADAATGPTPDRSPAEVRVFPPIPLDGWPKELAKLQVSGTDLDDPHPPPAPDPAYPVLWLNPEVEMSAGKAMAQAGHAAQLAWWDLSDTDRKEWREAGFPLAVRTAGPERWARLVAGGLPAVLDAGFTEIAPGSRTVIADHPALRD
ncbi:peptidyl-tRNA hydrolase [Streptomyces sp. NBC_01317]|uniref:peptidyl-tRNA hydrolase n=1 Tax=Streptomyces sp. NBC_01317 TaxID=2903822 RepID=UPI002E144308|nr:peptidyl-tRNA hydrolase [Streptomyces sp. NBC_01317]